MVLPGGKTLAIDREICKVKFLIENYSPLGQSNCTEIHSLHRQSDAIHNPAGKLKDYYFFFNRVSSISLAFFIRTVEYIPHNFFFLNSQLSGKIN